MNVLVNGAIASSLILLVTLAAMPLLRRRPAALRHGVLAAALACAAIAPVVGQWIPSWQLPVALTSVAADRAVPDTGRSGPASARPAALKAGNRPATSLEPSRSGRLSVAGAIRAIWVAGALAGALVLAAGLVQLARVARQARRLEHGVWPARAESISQEYGLSRPVALLVSAHPSLLVTWGLLRPKVVLPSAAAGWPDERVRIVLYHELAHIRRRDWIVLLAAELLKCVYWFNPLMWMAVARLRQEGEHACDDAVINRGVDGTEYASHLVDIARDLKQQRYWIAAPAIARPSSLERRVRAMLDTRLNRRPVTRVSYAAILFVMLAITIPIASAQGGYPSLTGSIVDPMNGVLPGVTLVLTNPQTQAKYEVRTDATGRYEFVAVPAGEYLFEAKLPGFASFSGKITVGAQNVQRDLTLDVGSLQETITVMSSRSAPFGGSPSPAKAALPKRPLPGCATRPESPAVAGAVRVGGNIRAPRKLKDVRPLYPSHLASQGVEGTVTLKARIGTDGMVEDLEVVSAAHAELGHAASDAVRQWEFDETLLNCKPVAVTMTVTVTFSLQP
jgi:TonB family protein